MAKVEGYKYLAVIENSAGYNHKDYFFALYDDNIQIGDLVAVTGSASGHLFKVKNILSVEEAKEIAPKNISAEVIGRVDTTSYDKRVKNRILVDQLRKQLFEKRKEIEARKDDEYYAELDPEYAEILKELRSLSV